MSLRPVVGAIILTLAGIPGLASCGDGSFGAAERAPALPTVRLTVEAAGASASLTVEIASTPSQRQQGLMFRQSLGEDEGMLFVFPADAAVGFWMKNTYIPLTIAYLDAAGRVRELRDGRPLDETILTPSGPYRYALEVNQGWFERHGLGVGARVILPPNVPPGE